MKLLCIHCWMGWSDAALAGSRLYQIRRCTKCGKYESRTIFEAKP